jgi:hypothetical protein
MATRQHRSVRLLLLAASACLALVVLTHGAERLGILPGMGWGLPNSPGHYLDLISAVSGISLLVAAGLAHFVGRVPKGE